MLHRIFGRGGSGKTQYIADRINDCSAMGLECLYIVPEQQSMDAELLLEKAGASSLSVSVLNFERLPDHVFRYIGGVARKSLDKAGTFVCLSNAVSALSDRLTAYANPTEKNITALFSTITSLKRLNITPDGFDGVCESVKLKCSDALRIKLSELSLIYREYEKILEKAGSDSADAATLLSKALKEEPFFEDKAVFIDGMYTYTEQQYDIIARIAEQAKELFISFTADDDTEIFSGTNGAARRIKALAGGISEDILLPENRRTDKADLRYLEANIWRDGTPFAGVGESIELCRCADRREEALYAAERVYALHKAGMRFADIAVACRKPEDYDGIIDVVFARYSIPFYFAQKESAATKPLSAFVTGILEMAEKNCTPSAVKKYIKSSFSVLNAAESDEVLAYAEGWRLRGRAWYADREWLANPDGYCEYFTPSQEARLKRLNLLRERFSLSVAPVLETLRGKNLTVGEAVKALYAHLVDCDVKSKLATAAEAIRAAGDADGAAKLLQLWGVVTDIFDRLFTLSADRKITAGELREEIELLLSAYDIGAIPAYTDAVNIGSARLMRAGGCRAMIVLGVNDGVFPSTPEQSGIFNADESAVLEDGGIELLPSPEKAMDEECFFFYNCVAAPTDYLSLSYVLDGNGNKCSLAFKAVQTLFPFNAVREFGSDERDYIFCKTAAFDRLPYIKNKALKRAVRERLAESGATLPENRPLRDESAYIGELDLKLLVLSATKIEAYNDCHFKYLLTNILRLKQDRVFNFKPTVYGTFLHSIVEKFMKKRMESGVFVSADEAEISAEVEAAAEGYFDKMFADGMPKRMEMLIGRLKESAKVSCGKLNREFSQSDFVPMGFEVVIGEGGVTPPSFVTDSGKRITTRGLIDRVDIAIIDGKQYARVEDYKSSKKTLHSSDIAEGRNVQMLSYLFAYCDHCGTEPAGAIYYPLELGAKPCGIVSDDTAVLSAMHKESIGSVQSVDGDGFASLKEQCYAHIKETGEKILSGDMDIKPFKLEELNCGYCPYGEVCRMQKKQKF